MSRWRATVVVVVATLVVATVGTVVVVDRGIGHVTPHRLRDRQVAVTSVATAVEAILEASTTTVSGLAHALEPWAGGTPDELTAAGEAVTSSDGSPRDVLIVDTDTIVRAASAGAADRLGTMLDDPAVVSALAGRTEVTGPRRDGDGGAVIVIGVPLHDGDGAVSGAVIGFLDALAGPIADALTTLALPGAEVALVGELGAVVSSEEGLGVVDGDDPNTREPAERATAGPGVVRAYRGEADVVLLGVFAPVDDHRVIVASEPLAAFREPVRRPAVLAAIASGLLLAVALAAFAIGVGRARRSERVAEDAKRSLLAVTGHELRTPLTVVRGLAQTLVARWENLPDSQRLELLRTLERQGRVLDHLVERLLYAAQLEAGVTGVVTARPVDAGRFAAEAVETHLPLAPTHDFETDIERPLLATADPKALEQILFHLIENAVKYSPSGGTITVRANADGSTVRIAVEDEGVGLPADPQRLFQRFVQGESVMTRSVDEGGVGLGLHIVRTLAELMGGSVHAEPNVPRGSRFVVTLRRADS